MVLFPWILEHSTLEIGAALRVGPKFTTNTTQRVGAENQGGKGAIIADNHSMMARNNFLLLVSTMSNQYFSIICTASNPASSQLPKSFLFFL